MAILNKLNNTMVKSVTETGLMSDGGGLYLQVTKAATKSWLLRYRFNGKRREMGLGSYRDVGLADARELASEARKMAKSGTDPIEDRKKRKEELARLSDGQKTFKECALVYIASLEAGWKHPKHGEQWKNSLANHVYPVFGNRPVADVDDIAVRQVLGPIWNTKTETATRIRSRIERVLDWARVMGYRNGENPARWRGNLQYIYSNPDELKKVKHYDALPYKKMSQFIKLCRERSTLTVKAIELMILTAARPSEAREALWSEFDFEENTWTLPADRMKPNVEHVVPLSVACLKLLKSIPKVDGEDYLFPSSKQKAAISDSILLKTTKSLGSKIGHEKITCNGFRSSFRNWAGEMCDVDRQVPEFSLSHKIKDKVEAAYFRTNLLDKRRILMESWAAYCEGSNPQNVVNIRTGAEL